MEENVPKQQFQKTIDKLSSTSQWEIGRYFRIQTIEPYVVKSSRDK
jgi:hypothetical protein